MTQFPRFAYFWLSLRTQISLFQSFLTKLVRFSRVFFFSLDDSSFLKGHRVATQYILAALEGTLPAEHLLHYREAESKLPGHPELGLTPGVKFSSGRLGHMWYADPTSLSIILKIL